MNENSAYIFEIETPADWIFAGEPVWIGGWFVSKTGAVFSDVRAVIEGIPYLGIFGLPRPDIERRFRGYAGLPHAGFSLRVRPPRSARTLRIELLDAGHRWVEIFRVGIKVKRGDNTIGRFNSGVLPDQMHRLLQARRADPAADLAPLADQLALEAASVPLDTLPNPPFFGALEKPELIGGTQFGKVRVEGWIIHREQRIERLTASTHPLTENELDYGDRPRPEAGLLFPDHPFAARSQYFGMLDIDENAPGPAVIKMFAELGDGTKHLVFTRRFYPRSCNVWERPLPVFNRRDFFICARALIAASRRRRIRLGRLSLAWRALTKAYRDFRRDAPARIPPPVSRVDPYSAWQSANRLTPRLRQALLASSPQSGAGSPVFALIVSARNCSQRRVDELADSLLAQLYPHWEACFVGLPPSSRDPRLRHQIVDGPKDTVRALNAAAQRMSGTLLASIPGDSRLSPDALLEIAERFASRPELELVYTDEDRMDDAGFRSDPDFKPEWSPAFALSGLFPGQLSVIRRARWEKAGAFREGFGEVPWYDVLLRTTDSLGGGQVAHVPLVCHHAYAGRPRELSLDHPAYEQSRRALAETARRRAWPADAFLPAFGHHRQRCFQQLSWSPAALAGLPVTIVIPTRDKLHLLQECIELLEETVDWRYAKLVIVDDHSRDTDALRYLEQIVRRKDLQCTVVRTPNPHAAFNYSKLVNAALPHVDTPLILHLNNDVNALERGWLEEMAAWFTQSDVGVVGAKLVYSDKTLNHTGIVIGPHGGLADTPFARIPDEEAEPGWHAAVREVSAVTGACLMTRASLYRQLGGFDEKDFGVSYNDVDYCLRVRASGHRVIYTPQARLMHWGSATRGVTFDESEHIAFIRRYPGYADPYFSPHWSLPGPRPVCRGAYTLRTHRAGRLRLLLVTHNLNLEGAPLFLLDYATYAVEEAGFAIQILSAQDGPLRSSFEELGATVTVVDAAHVCAAEDDEFFHSRIADLAFPIAWEEIDLVVCNTLAGFWGVHLAQHGGKPSLFYIHESTSVFRFFENVLQLPLHRLVEEAFITATRVLFLCHATRAYYEDFNLRENFRLVPSWIRLDDIASFGAAHSRTAMRARHGFRDDEIVVANIGTVCERKGQHIFIRAIDHFRHHHPGQAVRFVMVGARPGIYLDLLKRDLARMGLSDVVLVPETREVFDFFRASDLFVCTSFEESFPRVVLEAMAFRTPLVSTDVHGISELIGQRQEGYLVKAGEVENLSRMMWTCLAKERSGKSLTPTAFSKVLRFHDYTKVLPVHLDVAREAWLAHE